MRILIVTTEFPPMPGGIATLVYEQARGLAKIGHVVEVLTVQSDKASGENEQFAVHYVQTNARAIIRLIPLTLELRSSVRNFRPDFIWCPTYRGFGMPVALISKVRGIPFGIYLHGTEVNTESRRSMRRRVMAAVLSHARLVACNSRNTRNLVQSRFSGDDSEITVITPGVDFERIGAQSNVEQGQEVRAEWNRHFGLSTDDDPVYCLSLCRMAQTKGIDTVLAAMSTLQNHTELKHSVYYVVAGGGPDLEVFRAMAKQLQIDHKVLFLGDVAYNKTGPILNAADIYVQPSRPVGDFLESFGISFLEAQAAGLPCIGSNWGGVPEAVLPGKTAVLVNPGDVDSVANAISELAGNDALRESWSAAGRAWAADNTWTAHSASLHSVILKKVENG